MQSKWHGVCIAYSLTFTFKMRWWVFITFKFIQRQHYCPCSLVLLILQHVSASANNNKEYNLFLNCSYKENGEHENAFTAMQSKWHGVCIAYSLTFTFKMRWWVFITCTLNNIRLWPVVCLCEPVLALINLVRGFPEFKMTASRERLEFCENPAWFMGLFLWWICYVYWITAPNFSLTPKFLPHDPHIVDYSNIVKFDFKRDILILTMGWLSLYCVGMICHFIMIIQVLSCMLLWK